MITRKASKTAIGRCKGIDGLMLSAIWKEAEDRVMQKACHSCCLNGLNNLQDSSFKTNNELPTNKIGGWDSLYGISTKCIIYLIHTENIP